ncbi:3-deoxy-manno-octulosonate cytidylyltransferase [Suttonella ornithocola]|uniref:3-deoxy-manno-octulosonate cytidylyltransferase n=1 Tax=Suttonella ornithocola TaxID=279832 RepID=A0A380MS55_9GAMM|nr:3-deoxy-manno-octulosonate cytidylyltransferase [Suttonella ornithocola]SUO95118.1 3-deoxy-manno-octulosonate cytidylyltransferase [Suttonella ornithocola]
MNAVVVIPARFNATRLPGKPLCDLAGLPMIVRTAKRAMQSGLAVWVAYDDERIAEVLRQYGIQGIPTRHDHENGTHRLSEVVQKQEWSDETVVVNVQGDEPLLPAELITQVADALIAHPDASVATLSTPFIPEEDPGSPHMVKVVCDLNGYALYFSRSLLPYPRDAQEIKSAFPYQRHIGIYAYRAKALRDYPQLSATPLEQTEKLEQLRFLEHGRRIIVAKATEVPPAGVDTEEDRIRVDALLRVEK